MPKYEVQCRRSQLLTVVVEASSDEAALAAVLDRLEGEMVWEESPTYEPVSVKEVVSAAS